MGTGAALFGGRWNPKGILLLYTSKSIALALLENVVHLNPIHFPELSLLTLDIEKAKILTLNIDDLPENWNQFPSPTRLAEIGKKWALKQESEILAVPSAIVPQSKNYLLNCLHPNFKKIKLLNTEEFIFDRRLYNDAFGTID